jgi:hypothetical protein
MVIIRTRLPRPVSLEHSPLLGQTMNNINTIAIISGGMASVNVYTIIRWVFHPIYAYSQSVEASLSL